MNREESTPRAWSSTLRSAGAAVARRFFLDRQSEFWLGELNPAWSLREIRARVAAVIDETDDVKTFVLEPNAHWPGHRAGQYTTVEVEIDGVRTRRCYSLSSAPGAAAPAITVKRTPGGRVSGWLHDHVKPGGVLRLAPPAGDFVLPEPRPAKLLMLSGGSGITPLMSILRDLDARGAGADVAFLHYARSERDVIFGAELRALAARRSGLRLLVRVETGPGAAPLFSEPELRALVPDWAARDTLLCGPPGLMDRVESVWRDAGLAARLRRERFALPAPLEIAGGATARVTLARSERTFTTDGRTTLLEGAERAGASPAFGCRMGICQTCRCRKASGTVQNVLTGEVSIEPDEEIQICISVARSDVALEI